MFNFEKLEVWKKAIEFADLVYSSTRNFPTASRSGDLQIAVVLRSAVCKPPLLVYDAAEEQSRTLSGLRKSLVPK
jgi:hypothetical protein